MKLNRTRDHPPRAGITLEGEDHLPGPGPRREGRKHPPDLLTTLKSGPQSAGGVPTTGGLQAGVGQGSQETHGCRPGRGGAAAAGEGVSGPPGS